MIETNIAHRIREKFSKVAENYDKLAHLQQAVGLRLLKDLRKETPQCILDIGMGTGWFTEKLCTQFPSAKIAGIDFALGMVELAKRKKCRFKIVSADAVTLPFKNESFDMVVSNLTYQWIRDLEFAFREAYRVMNHKGGFFISVFSQRTLQELFFSIEEVAKDKNAFLRLPSQEEIISTLAKNGFEDIYTSSELIRVQFFDVMTLLRWLKSIGANTSPRDVFLGREFLVNVEDVYKRNFHEDSRIYASFETLWISARK